MDRNMQINGQSIPIIEMGGVRLVTMKQIAELHQVNVKNIRTNFLRNRKQFIEGTDFIEFADILPGYNLSPGGQFQTRIFFTETGYLMLVKSLTDDLAWRIQRLLVTRYFRESVIDDLWVILPKVSHWCLRLSRKGYSDSQVANYVMANYRLLERDIRQMKRRKINIKPLELEDGKRI